MDLYARLITGLFACAAVSTAQEEYNNYVNLSFTTEDGVKYNSFCNARTTHSNVMSFNIWKVKAIRACQCTVQMGENDQFLDIEALNGSSVSLLHRLIVRSGITEEFQIGISSMDDVYIRVEDKEEVDLFEGYFDTLLRLVAKTGPTHTIECQDVPQELIRSMNINYTVNGTMPTTEPPEPMDITLIVIGIVIGIIVLIVLATILIFVILYIKRQDRKNYKSRKGANSGTDYMQVPRGETDKPNRRPHMSDVDINKGKLAHPLPMSEPGMEAESAFGGASSTGGHKPHAR